MAAMEFSEESVLEAARQATGLSDFGDDGFREGLRVLLETYRDTAGFDERDSTTTDSVTLVTIETGAGAYIETGTGRLRSKIGYLDTGRVLFPNWAQAVDQVVWEIAP